MLHSMFHNLCDSGTEACISSNLPARSAPMTSWTFQCSLPCEVLHIYVYTYIYIHIYIYTYIHIYIYIDTLGTNAKTTPNPRR